MSRLDDFPNLVLSSFGARSEFYTVSFRNTGFHDTGPFSIHVYLSVDRELDPGDHLHAALRLDNMDARTTDQRDLEILPIELTADFYNVFVVLNVLDEFEEAKTNDNDNLQWAYVPHFAYLDEGGEISEGGVFDDRLTGTRSSDIYLADGGDDTMIGGWGSDAFYGDSYYDYGGRGRRAGLESADNPGFDIVSYDVSAYNDTPLRVDMQNQWLNRGFAAGDSYYDVEGVIGTNQADVLRGDAQDNLLAGLHYDDTLVGRDGNDTLSGGPGADLLVGGPGLDMADYRGEDRIPRFDGPVTADLGNSANNTGEAAGDMYRGIEGLAGSIYDDHLSGNARGNVLSGRRGDDTLVGREGSDILMGGPDSDLFVFAPGDGRDVITDFDPTQDRIDLSAYGFSDIADAMAHARLYDEQYFFENGASEGYFVQSRVVLGFGNGDRIMLLETDITQLASAIDIA